jgi:hypothetical protein
MKLSPASCHFIPLRSKYSPQHSVLILNLCSSLNVKGDVSYPHKTTGKVIVCKAPPLQLHISKEHPCPHLYITTLLSCTFVMSAYTWTESVDMVISRQMLEPSFLLLCCTNNIATFKKYGIPVSMGLFQALVWNAILNSSGQHDLVFYLLNSQL